MTNAFQAIVRTTDGVFRAYLASPTSICITEDGVNGVQGIIDVEDSGLVQSPEFLVKELKCWIYEHVRGLDLLEVHLTLRDG